MQVQRRTRPENGDVIVRQDVCDGVRRFVLHVVPGPDQVAIGTREDAIQEATAFARRQGVRVWLADSDLGFTLVDDFRSRQVPGGRHEQRHESRTPDVA